ncbi:dTDP-4-dehydrorhamnose 3,5-epimerase [Altererythrobacter sp.]|uniref:dTDP-4-dehydrorhamnose 3,5-epimerase n=1 Tax=Altererythrobacter sp. TaxID=1872480 RepID=UPI003D0AA2BA
MTSFARHAIPGIVEIVPQRHGDDRGFFSETYRQSEFEKQGIRIDWVQDNQSISVNAGTIRGLHFQSPPLAQHKLVRVLRGAIYDVALDIRKGSPHFGDWVGVVISAAKWNQLLIPAGFAHGFMTIEPETEVLYKVSEYWSHEHEGTIRWDDPDLAISWPALDSPPTLSGKDATAPLFRDVDSPFVFEGGQ